MERISLQRAKIFNRIGDLQAIKSMDLKELCVAGFDKLDAYLIAQL